MRHDPYDNNQVDPGGTAFPYTGPTPQGGTYFCPGMTLRDWFAGQAVSAIIGKVEGRGTPDEVYSLIARNAYQAADAMLTARSRSDEPDLSGFRDQSETQR